LIKAAVCTWLQILTQEDWNEVLYNGMSKTSAWAALYFIFLMTFGNYVLFNLLVAILVEGFSSVRESIVTLDKKNIMIVIMMIRVILMWLRTTN